MSWGFGIKRTKTDAAFSDFIRARAGWKCEKCGKEPESRQFLQCSHFIGRGNKMVRWDRDNAASLCSYCHRKMGENPAAHYKWFESRLGEEGLEALIRRSHDTFKGSGLDEEKILLDLKKDLKEL